MHVRVVPHMRRPGGRRNAATPRPTPVRRCVALLAAVLAAGPVALGVAAPASAASAGAAGVVSTDAVLVWDGTRETFAVRWHLRAPVTSLRWLVATPSRATSATLADGAFGAVAAAVSPKDRWIVTHPWLLVSDEGGQARTDLRPALEPQAGSAPAARIGAPTAADRADPAVAAWAADAGRRGWTVHAVTVTVSAPTTLVGPVAVDFATPTPVVPSSVAPGNGRVTLVTVADRVLAAQQPDLAADADAAAATGDATDVSAEVPPDDPVADTSAPARSGRADASLGGSVPDLSAVRGVAPSLTVENARSLRVPPALVAGRDAPPKGWVGTLLAGSPPSGAPVVLLPQDGAIADWRTEVGVWWPGWGTAALAVLALVAGAALAVAASRRRTRRRTDAPAARATKAAAGATLAGATLAGATLAGATAAGTTAQLPDRIDLRTTDRPAGPSTLPDGLPVPEHRHDDDPVVDTLTDLAPVHGDD